MNPLSLLPPLRGGFHVYVLEKRSARSETRRDRRSRREGDEQVFGTFQQRKIIAAENENEMEWKQEGKTGTNILS